MNVPGIDFAHREIADHRLGIVFNCRYPCPRRRASFKTGAKRHAVRGGCLLERDVRCIGERGLAALAFTMLDRINVVAEQTIIAITLAARLGQAKLVRGAEPHFANATTKRKSENPRL